MKTQEEVKEKIKDLRNTAPYADSKTKVLKEINRLETLLYYLETNPSEDLLKKQEDRLTGEISEVEAKIKELNDNTLLMPFELKREKDTLKKKYNYPDIKNQLKNIQFLLY